MINNQRSDRNGGRPRRFENEDVFRATARALNQVGYGRLTLDIVAHEVGVSAPALSKRFGSKGTLMREYIEWMAENTDARFRRVRQEHDSPLAALLARYLIPMEERLEEFGPLTGSAEIKLDPELGPILEACWRIWDREVAALLSEAQNAGELIACNTRDLSRAIGAALGGETARWSPQAGPLLDRYRTAFATIIGPYMTDSGAFWASWEDEAARRGITTPASS